MGTKVKLEFLQGKCRLSAPSSPPIRLEHRLRDWSAGFSQMNKEHILARSGTARAWNPGLCMVLWSRIHLLSLEYSWDRNKLEGQSPCTLTSLRDSGCRIDLWLNNKLPPKLSGLEQQTLVVSQFLWLRNSGAVELCGFASGSPESLQPGHGQRQNVCSHSCSRDLCSLLWDVSTGECPWDMSSGLPRASDQRETDRQTKPGREEAREKEITVNFYDPVSEINQSPLLHSAGF